MSDSLVHLSQQHEDLVRGEVTEWNHIAVSGNIFGIFRDYLKGKKCTPVPKGFRLHLDDANRFTPDFMVVCDAEKIKPDGVYGAPDLIVEVLSHDTIQNDKVYKKNVYAHFGVKEYWLVDPSVKSLEVYHLSGSEFMLHGVYVFHEDHDLAQVAKGEQTMTVTQLKCSLFNDLDISLKDIFYRTF